MLRSNIIQIAGSVLLPVRVIVCAGLIGGCGSPKMAPIPPRTTGEFTCRASADGLEIAVDAWIDRDRVKNHFGMDLLSRQIVPFEVVFANVGAEGGFLLQPESVVVLDDIGLQEIDSGAGGISPSGIHPVAIAATYLAVSQVLAIGLAVIGQEAYRHDLVIQRHMDSVRFTDRPLYRSDSNRGFIFLRFADLTSLPKAAAVKFRMKNMGSRQEKALVVPLRKE